MHVTAPTQSGTLAARSPVALEERLCLPRFLWFLGSFFGTEGVARSFAQIGGAWRRGSRLVLQNNAVHFGSVPCRRCQPLEYGWKQTKKRSLGALFAFRTQAR